MRSNVQDVEQLLAELRDEVRALREKVEAPLPRILTYERAAHEMSISLSKLKQLVRTGALATCEIGKRKHVPLIEIERLERSASRATQSTGPGSTEGRPRSRRARREALYDARTEAEKIRAALLSKPKG